MKSVNEWTQHWDKKSTISNPVELNGYCVNAEPISWDLYKEAVVLPAINRLDISPGDSVLDIGCGSGLMMDEIEKITDKIFGVEPSKELLGRYKGSGLTYVGAAHDLPFTNERFDRILMFGVAIYFPDFSYFENVVNKAISLLNTDGKFLIGDLNIGMRPTENQYQWYDREQLLNFLDGLGLRYNLMSQNKLKREINRRWDVLLYAD